MKDSVIKIKTLADVEFKLYKSGYLEISQSNNNYIILNKREIKILKNFLTKP